MYIAIEGVIGVGKTTLARLLQPAFQSALVLEVFEENPFLFRPAAICFSNADFLSVEPLLSAAPLDARNPQAW
jgi:hypothetical protein